MTDEQSNSPEEEVQDPQQEEGGADTLEKVAGAMVTAADAIKAGATDASKSASNFVPAAGRVLSKTVYATCYYVSYGVVFPTLLVAGVFPKNNPVYHGLVDGGSAAKDAVNNMHERRAALKAASQAALDEAAAMGAEVGVAPA